MYRFQFRSMDHNLDGKIIISFQGAPSIRILGPMNHSLARASWNGEQWTFSKPDDFNLEKIWQIDPSDLLRYINGETSIGYCEHVRPGDRWSCPGDWDIRADRHSPRKHIYGKNDYKSARFYLELVKVKSTS